MALTDAESSTITKALNLAVTLTITFLLLTTNPVPWDEALRASTLGTPLLDWFPWDEVLLDHRHKGKTD